VTQSIAPKTGLSALLTPEESVLILIDHQPLQFANLHSQEPTICKAAHSEAPPDRPLLWVIREELEQTR
jgi:hypothetical protein